MRLAVGGVGGGAASLGGGEAGTGLRAPAGVEFTERVQRVGRAGGGGVGVGYTHGHIFTYR